MRNTNRNKNKTKPARAASFGRGVFEIIGGVAFGLFWLNVAAPRLNIPNGELIAYVIIFASVVTGLIRIVNGFNKIRVEQPKADECGSCGKKINSSFEFCPHCGSKVS